MRTTVWMIAAIVTVTAAVPMLVAPPRAAAQAVTAASIAEYLERGGYAWSRDEKSAEVFHVTKSTGLKKAQRVEIVITNLPKNGLVTVRAFPRLDGKYLSAAAVRNQAALNREMLRHNATSFGAYFIDEDGDIGFRYVFTTESGVGYEAFKVVLNELLRIADEPLIDLYRKFR